MAQRVNDVIELCCKIADRPEFRKTRKNIETGVSITGAGAAAGALLLGPPGFFVGGALGGLIAWWWTDAKFKSVPQLLKELPHAEKKKLYNDVVAVLDNLTWTDAADLVTIVMRNPTVQERVAVKLLNYIKNNAVNF